MTKGAREATGVESKSGALGVAILHAQEQFTACRVASLHSNLPGLGEGDCVTRRSDPVTCRLLLPSEEADNLDGAGICSTDSRLFQKPIALRGIMKAKLACSALLMVAISAEGATAQKPRVFITESSSPQASGDATVGEAKGTLAFTGGTSPENVEVMKAFARQCPSVTVTANREKADYVVRLDHEAVNPTTPFVHGNKVAVFDKNEDLMYSN